MKCTDHINIYTKMFYPWELDELQSLIADGLRSLKCKTMHNEMPFRCPDCKECEYTHICKTFVRIYLQINDIKAERNPLYASHHRENFLKKFTKKY